MSWVAAAAAISLLCANALYFAWNVANPLLRADEWRHLHMYLVPWYQGGFEWSALWQDHHPQPLTGLLLIANAEWFDLRMDYTTIFATGFSIVICGILLWRIWHSFEELASSAYLPVAAVLVSAVVFSLTALIVYTWSLVALGYIAACFSLLVLVAVDQASREGNARLGGAVALFVLVVLLVFSTGAKLYVYSAVAILAAQAVMLRQPGRVKMMGWLIGSLVLQRLFLSVLGNVGYDEISAAGSAFSKFGYWAQYLEYIGVGLMSGWVNLERFALKWGLDANTLAGLGFATVGLYVFTLWLYARSGLMERTVIPGVFLLVALATGLAAALVRFQPELESPAVAEVPRYYLLYFTGVIACVWVWFYALARSKKQWPAVAVGVCLTLGMGYLQYFSSAAAWSEASGEKRRAERALRQMRFNWASQNFAERPRFSVLESNLRYYKEGMPFLEAHRLNLFADDFPANRAGP